MPFTVTRNAIATGDICEHLHEEGTQHPVQGFTSYHLIALGKGWGDMPQLLKYLP